ncbi:hypothetical protein QMK33_19810 [Hymenobacter sp. H14-R3]|uniref:hypothetical protein n=1 Tax=Hymenobacter sp. H14-R3 TaxID=3046308 RepID=UPI0024BA25E3|nr:hypothetical protein [Hymenobacter sp. H14-R3]MDJ0367401.1 hypothetical protein [Hymenobacter sp. H14-R3]
MYVIPTTCSSTPLLPRTFLASEVTKAATRVTEVATRHPSWPSSRVRATIARELNISTRQLRYLLQQAAK